MSHTWPIVLRGGMLSPRGYPPLYALMIVSHRVLRYARRSCTCSRSRANVALAAPAARGALYCVALALQLALLLAAALGGVAAARARCSSRATTC